MLFSFMLQTNNRINFCAYDNSRNEMIFYYVITVPFVMVLFLLWYDNEKRRFYFVCTKGLIYRASCPIKSKYEFGNFPFDKCTDLDIRIILVLAADNNNKIILLDIRLVRNTTDQNNHVSNKDPAVYTPAKAREARSSQFRPKTRNSRATSMSGLGLRGKCAKRHNIISAKMRTPGGYNAESDATERTPAVEMTPLAGSVAAGASRRLARGPMVGRRAKTKDIKGDDARSRELITRRTLMRLRSRSESTVV